MVNTYLTNSYSKNIETVVENVRKIKNKTAISLRENIFYPGGGGQLPDKGVVCFEGSSEIPVLRVLKISGEVFLSLSLSREVSIGESVNARIDWSRRYEYMRCHTAAHVVMSAIRRNIENYSAAGVNIAEKGGLVTVKFDGYWAKNEKKAKEFIEIANKVIRKDGSIIMKTYKNIAEATSEYSDIYRGPREFKKEARIIIIDEWDANPCGGTHVKRLKELGELKLASFEDQEITFSLRE